MHKKELKKKGIDLGIHLNLRWYDYLNKLIILNRIIGVFPFNFVMNDLIHYHDSREIIENAQTGEFTCNDT